MTESSGSVPGDAFAPLEGAAYELRFTRRALDDLGCGPDIAPGDLDQIESTTKQRSITSKFRALRREVPTGTQAPMRDVGRHDIYTLHGFDGDRACTWYDDEAGVCWFLGWVSEHDYMEFETRAVNGELLPDEDDYTVLEVERESLDFQQRVGSGIRKMVNQALDRPRTPIRPTVGDLLQLDVSVEVVPIDQYTLVDLYITVGVPPLAKPPEGWPRRELPTRLAELATEESAVDLDLDYPAEVPGAGGSVRTVDFAHELAVAVRNWTLPEL